MPSVNVVVCVVLIITIVLLIVCPIESEMRSTTTIVQPLRLLVLMLPAVSL